MPGLSAGHRRFRYPPKTHAASGAGAHTTASSQWRARAAHDATQGRGYASTKRYAPSPDPPSLRFGGSTSPRTRGEVKLERQHHVEHLLAVTRLLHIGDLAAPAIGDARLRDLAGIDGVVALDVLRPHHAGHDQFADLEIDANFLAALDH